MIIVVEPQDAPAYRGLLAQMFRLRARVFQEKMRWDVNVSNGMERDKYDDEGPVYLLHTDDRGEILKGSLRLLPTTGPTLLADVFSDTLPDAAFLSSPAIWECTRFCIDVDQLLKAGREEVLLASCTIIETLGALGVRAGIKTILGNFAPSMLRVYRQIGCEVEVLGCTRRYGYPVYLGSFPVSTEHLERIRERLCALRLRLKVSQANLVLAA